MPSYPLLYQVNIRVLLNNLGRKLNRDATFDDITDEMLNHWASMGFEWVWLLSVWQLGPAAQLISRSDPGWLTEFQRTLPDLRNEDIGGSGFAIQSYTVSRELGGDQSLARLRERMKRHGLKLMLDFVPNHIAPDHPWINDHPEYLVLGSEADLQQQPQNFRRVSTAPGERIVALGRDPYFAGWQDTLQLNYGSTELQSAMRHELQRIAGVCDGVRCDMAMLILPDIFKQTWGIETNPFWPDAIREVRGRFPEFLFLAEVYWDLEWELQQQGFDYCYDKRLYDRLREGHATPIRQHLTASLDYQSRLARFLENHDEARAASAFLFAKHPAAAVITYLTPGLRFFHDGQMEGRQMRVSPHLLRAPEEPINEEVQNLYRNLMTVLRLPVVRHGEWRLLDALPVENGNHSNQNLVAYQWKQRVECLLAVVNLSDTPSQAIVKLAWDAEDYRKVTSAFVTDFRDPPIAGKEIALDLRDDFRFDLNGWGVHVQHFVRK